VGEGVGFCWFGFFVGFFLEKNNCISKKIVLRQIKRYRGVIQSENYKTW
jgi:hypothetical protein